MASMWSQTDPGTTYDTSNAEVAPVAIPGAGSQWDQMVYGTFRDHKQVIDQTLQAIAQQAGLPASFDWTPYLEQAAQQQIQQAGKVWDERYNNNAEPVFRVVSLASQSNPQLAPLAQQIGPGSDAWAKGEQRRQQSADVSKSSSRADTLGLAGVFAGPVLSGALSAGGAAGGTAAAGEGAGLSAELAAGAPAAGELGAAGGAATTASGAGAGSGAYGALTAPAAVSAGTTTGAGAVVPAALGSGITAGTGAGAGAGAGAGVGTAGALTASSGFWPAVLQGGASLIAGGLGAQAAGRAADAQVASTDKAISEQRRQYDISRADQAPFMQTGTAANERLRTLLGLAPGADAGSLTRRFSDTDLQADPVYKSGLDFGATEGRNAINARAIAGGLPGGYDSGATLKALTRFGTDYGSTKANESYNRYTADQNNIFNRLAGVSGAGQVATGQVQAAGTNAANQISEGVLGAGNARAAGIVGSANALGTGFTGVGNAAQNYQNNQILQELLKRRAYAY